MLSLSPNIHTQIASFAPLEVALGMYERVYYPLTSDPARATGDKAGKRAGIVVDIDRTAGTPLVTLRSPLLVCMLYTCMCWDKMTDVLCSFDVAVLKIGLCVHVNVCTMRFPNVSLRRCTITWTRW